MPSHDDIVKAVSETNNIISNINITTITDNELGSLNKQVERLADLNSSFPVVQSFLNLRGLTHINQLDEQGHTELLVFLEDMVKSIKENKQGTSLDKGASLDK